MPVTYTPIASTTLSSTATTVTFSSIPSTYTDLVAVLNVGATADVGSAIRLRFNGDSSSNYSVTYAQGLGSTANSARETGTMMAFGYQIGIYTGIKHSYILNIMNYKNPSTYKGVLMRSNGTDGTSINVGLWRSTSAINEVSFRIGNYDSPSGTWAIGSQFTIYGIATA